MSKNRSKGPYLVGKNENGPSQLAGQLTSKVEAVGYSGSVVLVVGDYTIHHQQHRLPEKVTLLDGERFPKCEACEHPVEFRLSAALPGLTRAKHPIILNRLPLITNENAREAEVRVAG